MLLQRLQLPLMSETRLKMTVPYMEWRTLLRLQPRHGPDRTWQKGPWGCRLMEDRIELVFLGVRGDWKTKPIINNSLKV